MELQALRLNALSMFMAFGSTLGLIQYNISHNRVTALAFYAHQMHSPWIAARLPVADASILRMQPKRVSPVFSSTSISMSMSMSSLPSQRRNSVQVAIVDSSDAVQVEHRIEENEPRTEQPVVMSQKSSLNPSGSSMLDGLSKSNRMLWQRTRKRQQFVTGRYPIIVEARFDHPTRRWLWCDGNRQNDDAGTTGTTHILVNGTSADQSLASFDRFQWLDHDDDNDDDATNDVPTFTLELEAEINIERPGYVRCLPSNVAGSTASSRRRRLHGREDLSHNKETVLHGHAPLLSSSRTLKERLLEPFQKNDETGAYGTATTNRIWVTGFSLSARKGLTRFIDYDEGIITSVNSQSGRTIQWPNEVSYVPKSLCVRPLSPPSSPKSHEVCNLHQDAILVADGFLVPGKDRGGIYIIKNPGDPIAESTICITSHIDSPVPSHISKLAAMNEPIPSRWFYHRASWIDLTGDGRMSIITARAQVAVNYWGKGEPGSSVDAGLDKSLEELLEWQRKGSFTSGISKRGQLLWLEMPKPDHFDPISGQPRAADGSLFDPLDAQYLPWKEHVLAQGPDVMFALGDLDTSDDTIEVFASEFFNQRLTLFSIRKGLHPRVVFQRTIDNQCGAAFGVILADLDTSSDKQCWDRLVIDSGSTVDYPSPGCYFSHIITSSHECKIDDNEDIDRETIGMDQNGSVLGGGSIFAYRVPLGKGKWRTEAWHRTTIASGFKVRTNLSNMINPGAPGLLYTFYAHVDDKGRSRPMLAVAGDCAESAHIFRPDTETIAGIVDSATVFKLMVEIKTKSTVGSIGIDYNPSTGYARLHVPCFEKDKILVFSMGTSKDIDYEIS
jgi:hypothetical protein